MMRALYFLLLRYTQAAAKLGHRELRAASGTLFLALTVDSLNFCCLLDINQQLPTYRL